MPAMPGRIRQAINPADFITVASAAKLHGVSYLEFISALDDPTLSTKTLDKISQPERHADRTDQGFNFFAWMTAICCSLSCAAST